MPLRDIIENNWRSILDRVANATRRVGREPEAVTLVAVTKYAEPAWVQELVSLGQRHLGESRPQQLARRAAEFAETPTIGDLKWHLIGHLQRNKVELVVPTAHLIHSVDSFRLLDAIQHEAKKRQCQARVLLEVNVSGEASKDGFVTQDLMKEVGRLSEYDAVNVVGLMTMAPDHPDPEQARPVFRALNVLRNELTTASDGRLMIPQLSMGMSGDFEVAIEEGATLVRVGSSLFEGCSTTLQR